MSVKTDFLGLILDSASIESAGDVLLSNIRPLPAAFYRNIGEMTGAETAYVVLSALLGHDFDAEKLRLMATEWIGQHGDPYFLSARLLSLLMATPQVKRIIGKRILLQVGIDNSSPSVMRAFADSDSPKLLTLQAQGVLKDFQRVRFQELAVVEDVAFVKCDQYTLGRVTQRLFDNNDGGIGEKAVLLADTGLAFIPGFVYVCFDILRRSRAENENSCPVISAPKDNASFSFAAKLVSRLGLPVTFEAGTYNEIFNDNLGTNHTVALAHIRYKNVAPTARGLLGFVNEHVEY